VPEPGATGVAPDTGIAIHGFGYGIDGSRVDPSRFPLGRVSLSDAAGNQVPLGQPTNFSGTQPMFVYRPLEELEPGTNYRVSAELSAQDTERPTQAGGSEKLEFVFTTGSERLGAIELSGALSAELVLGEAPIQECGPCGGDCTQTGTRPALFAHVSLPVPTGGMAATGYRGWLYFSNDQPVELLGIGDATGGQVVNLQTYFEASPSERVELDIEVVDEELAYRPCFVAQFWDARAVTAESAPLCLDAVKPSEHYTPPSEEPPVAPPPDDSPSSGGAADDASSQDDSRETSKGCSCGVTPSKRTNVAAWVSTGLLLCALARRRRGSLSRAVGSGPE
jgi:hypothetical protein